MEINYNPKRTSIDEKENLLLGGVALAMLPFTQSNAQNPGIRKGAQVIEQQATALQAYFEPVTTIIYVIAAIMGLIGGFRIYSKWQNGVSNDWIYISIF